MTDRDVLNAAGLPESVARKFWSRVDSTSTPDRCWPWTGSLNAAGRGRFTYGGQTRYAYVWALVLSGTPVEPGHPVRHLCGNPTCCRPSHLSAEGGQRANNLDTVRHGRHRSAKLNARKARRIRERWAAPDRPAQRDLAAEYGVTPSAISAVVTGKTWPESV